MSGGVDSSVAAALLKNQGYDVIGAHLQLWDHSQTNLGRFGGRCCSWIDPNDARRVCDRLDVPYHVMNAQDLFEDKVVDYLIHEVLQCRAPNPCVQCNNQIKFNYLFQKADELGCDFIATGHYAQVVQDTTSGFAFLKKAVDLQKDQSYFLFGLTQKTLRRTILPLGNLSKTMVRKLAEGFGLAVANKPDSQEICFVDDDQCISFIENRSAPSLRPTGLIRTSDGSTIGEHEGLHRYTIGKKKGLQFKEKEYQNFLVLGFDNKNQTLIVGPEEKLYHRQILASGVNWISPINELNTHVCKVRIRPDHEEVSCLVTVFENGRVQVQFDEPQRAMAPGQVIVFYNGDEILGGGFIDSTIESLDAIEGQSV